MAGGLKAVCFDLDGLLVDTEGHYYEAHRQVFSEHGYELSKREYALKWIIRGTRMELESPGFGIKADPRELLADVRRRFRVMADRELALMPYARDKLAEAAARFITALVTNAPREDAERILDRVKLRGFFSHIVTREDYAAPKPAPDGYRAAAGIIGQEPAHCLVLEDSGRGVRAAVAAGMPCVAVLNEMTRFEPPKGALVTVHSLSEVDFDEIGSRPPFSAPPGGL